MSKKTFTISKKGIERLKSISSINNISYLTRSVLLKDIGSSAFIRADVIDIPDDFNMAVYDINSFISTYKLFDDAYIDYTDLEKKGYIKIVNNKKSNNNNKELFIFRRQEESLMKFNVNVKEEESLIHNMGDRNNNFTISSSDVKQILKAGSILNADCISFKVIDDKNIKIEVFDTKSPNTNAFEMIINDVEVNFKDLYFNLGFELFSKLEKSVDEYDVSYCMIGNKNESTLINFKNMDNDLKYYFTNMLVK